MKLFSRGAESESQDNFDDTDLPTKEDLADDFFVEPAEPETMKARPASGNARYGIEEAIALMRTLPRENSDLIVTVVNKTLQSMDISVNEIIQDAENKEAHIRKEHKALEQEVKQLQEKISQRHQDISELVADLKETAEVKKRLLLSMEIEKKLNAPSPDAAPEAPPAKQEPPERPMPPEETQD